VRAKTKSMLSAQPSTSRERSESEDDKVKRLHSPSTLSLYILSQSIVFFSKLRSSFIGVSTYFPAAHSEEELDDIRLLLLLKLFDVLEGTHLDCMAVR
jgi:hypothetical protein